VKQVVDLRSGTPALVNASADMRKQFERECTERRAVMTAAHEVAPRMTVTTIRGVLHAGDEVSVADFPDELDAAGSAVVTPGWRRFERLVESCTILAKL
jgi:hypothetical protein